MNGVRAKKVLSQLADWIETIAANLRGAPPLLLLGPGHHSHPLSEFHADTRSFLVFLHEHAPALMELQRRHLPRDFWEEYGNLELDESDLTPPVRLLLAHREQPLVSAALSMVSRGGIDQERQYLAGVLPVLVKVMQAHVEDGDAEAPPPPPRTLVGLRSGLSVRVLWILQQLRTPACMGELAAKDGPASRGTIKRWLPRLARRGLIEFELDGTTKTWRLTDLGRAVVSLDV